jgi:hypothetical protein
MRFVDANTSEAIKNVFGHQNRVKVAGSRLFDTMGHMCEEMESWRKKGMSTEKEIRAKRDTETPLLDNYA